MKLRGTVLMLVLMIIQIVLNVIIFLALPEVGLLVVIDTILIIVAYVGFNRGVRGWAIFAVVYGVISAGLSLIQGTVISIGLGMFIAGIVALTDNN
jgi:hypothetical protein